MQSAPDDPSWFSPETSYRANWTWTWSSTWIWTKRLLSSEALSNKRSKSKSKTKSKSRSATVFAYECCRFLFSANHAPSQGLRVDILDPWNLRVKSWHGFGYRAIISPAFFLVVSVAQLVELWIVAPAAGGSNPLAHPISSFKSATNCTDSTNYQIVFSRSVALRVRMIVESIRLSARTRSSVG
jgi:hypothetical protein